MEREVVHPGQMAREDGDGSSCRSVFSFLIEGVRYQLERAVCSSRCQERGCRDGRPLQAGDLFRMETVEMGAHRERVRVQEVAGAVPGADGKDAVVAGVGEGGREPVGDELRALQPKARLEEGVARPAGNEVRRSVEGLVCVVLLLHALLGPQQRVVCDPDTDVVEDVRTRRVEFLLLVVVFFFFFRGRNAGVGHGTGRCHCRDCHRLTKNRNWRSSLLYARTTLLPS